MRIGSLALGLVAATLLAAAGARAEGPPEVRVAYLPDGVPAQAGDPAWEAAPETRLVLMAQLIVPPVGGGSASAVAVRAVHDGEWLAIRLAWDDPTADRQVGADRFRDAAAVGFPQTEDEAAGPPSPFMGDAAHPVTIWQWTADLETAAAGEGTAAAEPPTEGIWYFPDDAAVSARVRGWRGREPVGVFVATGFGTLERAATAAVVGASARTASGWTLVMRRRLQVEEDAAPGFEPGDRTHLIVALWDGAKGEVNGRKSVTMSWTPFVLDPVEEESHATR